MRDTDLGEELLDLMAKGTVVDLVEPSVCKVRPALVTKEKTLHTL